MNNKSTWINKRIVESPMPVLFCSFLSLCCSRFVFIIVCSGGVLCACVVRERTRQSTSNEWEMNTSQTSQHNKQKNNNKERKNTKQRKKHVGNKARVCVETKQEVTPTERQGTTRQQVGAKRVCSRCACEDEELAPKESVFDFWFVCLGAGFPELERESAVNRCLTTSATRGLAKHWLRLSVVLYDLSMLQAHGYGNATANLLLWAHYITTESLVTLRWRSPQRDEAEPKVAKWRSVLTCWGCPTAKVAARSFFFFFFFLGEGLALLCFSCCLHCCFSFSQEMNTRFWFDWQ